MATLSELLAQVGEIKKQEMASDPFFSVSQSLLGGQLQPSYGYNARDYIGANLAKNLLGGVFQGIAENNALDTSRAINSLLPSVLRGVTPERPSDLSESSYNKYLTELQGIKNLRDISQADKADELLQQALSKGVEAGAVESAKMQATKQALKDYGINLSDVLGNGNLKSSESSPDVKAAGEAIGQGGLNTSQAAVLSVLNPTFKPLLDKAQADEQNTQKQEDKKSANLLDLEKELRSSVLKGDVPQKFTDIKSNFDTMLSSFPIDSKAADLAIIAAFARIMDPQSTVREGEINNVRNAQDFLSRFYGTTKSFFNSEGRLDPQARGQFIQVAGEKYNAFGGQYGELVKNAQDLLSKQGGNKDNLIPYNFSRFDANAFMDKLKSPATTNPLIGAASQLKASGLSREDAYKQLMGLK